MPADVVISFLRFLLSDLVVAETRPGLGKISPDVINITEKLAHCLGNVVPVSFLFWPFTC